MTKPARLTLTGSASPQLLLRVMGLLAQRGHMPVWLDAQVADDVMVIRADLDDEPCLGNLRDRLSTLIEVVDVVLQRGDVSQGLP